MAQSPKENINHGELLPKLPAIFFQTVVNFDLSAFEESYKAALGPDSATLQPNIKISGQDIIFDFSWAHFFTGDNNSSVETEAGQQNHPGQTPTHDPNAHVPSQWQHQPSMQSIGLSLFEY